MIKKIISSISFLAFVIAGLASFQSVNTNAFFSNGQLRARPTIVAGSTAYNGLVVPDDGFIIPHVSTGTIGYYINTFTSITGANSVPAHPTNSDTNWEIQNISDMNNDTFRDLIWKHKTNGNVVIWYLNGQGYFKSGATLANIQAGDATFVGTAGVDFKVVSTSYSNTDNNKDIVFRSSTTGSNVIWYLNANGTFLGGVAAPAVADLNWRLAATVDANEDGVSDFVWQHSNGSFVVWNMTLAGGYSSGCLFTTYTNQPTWRIFSGKDTNKGSALGNTLNFDYAGVGNGFWFLKPSAGNTCLVFNSGSSVLTSANRSVDWNLNTENFYTN